MNMFKVVNMTIAHYEEDLRGEWRDRHKSKWGRVFVRNAVERLRAYKKGNGKSKSMPRWATHVATHKISGRIAPAFLLDGDYWDNNMGLELPDHVCGMFGKNNYDFTEITWSSAA